MILVIDNYDSFTYNLVQLLGTLNGGLEVRRNDAITPEEVRALSPEYLVLSPGPGTPRHAGNLVEIVRECGPEIPTLGVCLGHQAIAEAFGGRVVPAPILMHGKTSPVYHGGKGVFSGIPNPFEAGRYHSLVVDGACLPASLLPTAHSADGELMAMTHARHPVVGVQFHPESVLTPWGVQIVRNFLRAYRGRAKAAGAPVGGLDRQGSGREVRS
jgi:anthranilate synthase/aminodeoxychorismate synthase-like glutamine amidotransferase